MSFSKSKALWVVGGAVGLFYMVPRLSGNKANAFETPATRQIGDRWSAGGGATTHTPATATKRGDPNNVESSRENPTGIGSKHFEENFASQRPGEPGPFDKAWNNAHYGSTDKGK